MTAISATFSDFRIVKGRKVAQLIFETPLEAADEALRMLGGLPRPDAERWVGIAPLKAKPTAVPAPVANDAPPKERRPFHTLPRSQQAGIACDDPVFRAWIGKQPWKTEAARLHADEVWGRERNPNKWFGVFVCDRCGVSSRRWLDADPAAADRWDALYRDFLADTGQSTWERPA